MAPSTAIDYYISLVLSLFFSLPPSFTFGCPLFCSLSLFCFLFVSNFFVLFVQLVPFILFHCFVR